MTRKHTLLLFIILFIALFVRLVGNNWDQGWHLHPDERFLTMVGTDIQIPFTVAQYLDQHISSFNPVNKGHAFFVYGTFPLLINKALAVFLDTNTYDTLHLQGRALSGIADLFVVIILFKLVELIEKKLKLNVSIKYISAFLYAISVLPIQLSHFFTVDTFLNLFCWASLYFAVRSNVQTFKRSNVLINMSLSGLFLGLAFACKVSAVYFSPLIGILLLVNTLRIKKDILDWIPASAGMTIFIIFCYLALRFGSPYYFETGNLLDFRISEVLIQSLKTLKSYDNPAVLFPPANQWVKAPWYLSPLNLMVFGVGPFYFLMSVIGFIALILKKNKLLIVCMSYLVFYFIFQSLQYAKTMRYLIFLYPALAFFAAVGLSRLHYTLRTTTYALIFLWPLAFMSIYFQDHSRVAASKWMYQNMKAGSAIITEYWDDPLPLMVQDPTTRNYQGMEAHIFDPDTKEKWDLLNSQLTRADYYVMSSNRGWGSIPKTPLRYPIASKFYSDMFAGKAGYALIKQFSSYPSLRYLGIPLEFPDQWAEEAFTVYDHPLVSIFKKNK